MSHDETSGLASLIDPRMAALLQHMAKIEAGELILSVGGPAVFRVRGESYPSRTELSLEQVQAMLSSVLSSQQADDFERTREANVRLTLGASHFRINVFVQRGLPGMVVRRLNTQAPSLDELELPAVVSSLVLKKRGLILCVGDSASSRAPVLAALIDHRNASAPGHMLVIEDPIAYVHANKQCIVTQREVPFDTHGSADALRNAIHQATDLVAISEIRDAESMEAALAVAEAGGLCLAGLSAGSPVRAIERVLGFFPEQRHHEIRARLARVVRAVVGRREIDALERDRIAVLEIMLDTPAVVQAVKRGEPDQLAQAMAQSEGSGCRTLESSLLALVQSGRIAPVHALEASDQESALRRHMEKWIHEVHGVQRGTAPGVELRLASDGFAAPTPKPASERERKSSTTLRRPTEVDSGRVAIGRVQAR